MQNIFSNITYFINRGSLKLDLTDYIENKLVCSLFANKIMPFYCQLQ